MADNRMDSFEGLRARCAAGREAVLDEITRIAREHGSGVSDLDALLLDYPFRPAKALRPTLCVSVASALGRDAAAALPSAAALELLHNAFLLHDDVEDGSWTRRGAPTLHELHGVATAVNVADGMFALSLYPLLDNCEHIGIGPALAVLETIADTVRVTVEGQALELSWIRDNRWSFDGAGYREAYIDLVIRKTAHYSFVAPVSIGCIVADAPAMLRASLELYARRLGVAFQITDDILNLEGDEALYGKEQNGDLWEGKRTLILMHAIASEGDTETRARAIRALSLPRPSAASWATERVTALLDTLAAQGRIDAGVKALIAAEVAGERVKSTDDVRLLRALIDAHGSVAAARAVAVEECARAGEVLRGVESMLCEGEARRFLFDLVAYVTERLR